jgi:hypothetical protein
MATLPPLARRKEQGMAERPQFSDWLAKHRRGDLDDEIGTRLAEVVAAVHMLGKPGRLTITLAIEPNGRSVTVTDNIVSKVPEPNRDSAIYFATPLGDLTRDDPGAMWQRPDDPQQGEGPQEQETEDASR